MEDYVHFLLKCDTLSTIRYNHLVRLALYLEKIQVNTDYLVNSVCSCQNSWLYYSLFDVSFVVSDTAPTQIWLFIFPYICFHITQRWLCFCIFWPLVFPEVVNFCMRYRFPIFLRDNKRDVKQGIIQSRVLTGTYKT
jgi:hypothetical protein